MIQSYSAEWIHLEDFSCLFFYLYKRDNSCLHSCTPNFFQEGVLYIRGKKCSLLDRTLIDRGFRIMVDSCLPCKCVHSSLGNVINVWRQLKQLNVGLHWNLFFWSVLNFWFNWLLNHYFNLSLSRLFCWISVWTFKIHILVCPYQYRFLHVIKNTKFLVCKCCLNIGEKH